jgi:hypothetical protein
MQKRCRSQPSVTSVRYETTSAGGNGQLFPVLARKKVEKYLISPFVFLDARVGTKAPSVGLDA